MNEKYRADRNERVDDVDDPVDHVEGERIEPAEVGGVVPVLSEELEIDRKAVPKGGIRVHRRVIEHEEDIELPLRREHVDVRRVVIDREVDGPLPVRREGGVTIIPVVEEVLVTQKRFRLKEEIHISKTVRKEPHVERVTLKRQEAEIEEVDSRGRSRPVKVTAEQRTPGPTPGRVRRRSILDK
jgi:uncharacterized protein (TIGR02271 family)